MMKMKYPVLAAVVALGLVACGRKELVILHLNDTHSHFEPVRSGADEGKGGVIEIAAFVDSVRNAAGAENVLLLHAGDFNQGSSYYTELGGDLEIRTLNAMGFDVITLGNHEFDNGLEDLERRLASLDSTVRVVCSNYDFSTFEMGRYVKPYTVVEKAGLKIGVFGMLTDVTKVLERNTADRMPKLDDVETANKWAEYLKNEEKCDLVICLSHCGFNEDCALVPQTRNIDVVVGGHSHTRISEPALIVDLDGTKVPVVQDGDWGKEVGVLKY